MNKYLKIFIFIIIILIIIIIIFRLFEHKPALISPPIEAEPEPPWRPGITSVMIQLPTPIEYIFKIDRDKSGHSLNFENLSPMNANFVITIEIDSDGIVRNITSSKVGPTSVYAANTVISKIQECRWQYTKYAHGKIQFEFNLAAAQQVTVTYDLIGQRSRASDIIRTGELFRYAMPHITVGVDHLNSNIK